MEKGREKWNSLAAFTKGLSWLLSRSWKCPGVFKVPELWLFLSLQKRKEKMLRRRVLAQPFLQTGPRTLCYRPVCSHRSLQPALSL